MPKLVQFSLLKLSNFNNEHNSLCRVWRRSAAVLCRPVMTMNPVTRPPTTTNSSAHVVRELQLGCFISRKLSALESSMSACLYVRINQSDRRRRLSWLFCRL